MAPARSRSSTASDARAAPCMRDLGVSATSSSAEASSPDTASVTRTTTRRLPAGATSMVLKITLRRSASSRTADCSSASMGLTSAVCAMLIFRWSTLSPSCASSALSTLRTICLGEPPACVRMCTAVTSPTGETSTRADSTPWRLDSRFSARLTPHGSRRAESGTSGAASGCIVGSVGLTTAPLFAFRAHP